MKKTFRLSALSAAPFMLFISFASPAISVEDCIKAAGLVDEANAAITKNPQDAVVKLREAVAYCPGSAALRCNLASALYLVGKMVEAESQFEEALRIKPDFARALNAIAYINLTTPGGDKTRAAKLIKLALAIDPINKQYRQTYELIAGDVEDAPKTGISRPDAIAVIVGNRNYRNKLIPPVAYALQDAATMKSYLVESLGFDKNNVLLLEDAVNLDLVKYFGNRDDHRGILYNRTRANVSDIFIYYSGHGAPDTNTKRAYLIPVDADPSIIKLTGYSLDTLYENLAKLSNEKNPKSVMLVMDACFSGAYHNGMLLDNASPIYIETASPLLTMKNAVVFSSSKGNQISSWYPEKNHGLFTYFFLKALKEGLSSGNKLTAGDLELGLSDAEGVNAHAWRLFNREQEPQVIGNKQISLIP